MNTSLHGMNRYDTPTGPKKGFGATLANYSNAYFEGWGPTVTLLAGASIYCSRYDKEAPLKAALWAKDNFLETPKLVAYPAALLGLCCTYSYYKPRVVSLSKRIIENAVAWGDGVIDFLIKYF